MSDKNVIVIDAGNSATTVGLFRGATLEIHAATHIPGGISAARGQCAVALRRAFAYADGLGESVAAAFLSSVTPGVNAAWKRLVSEETSLELGLVSSEMALPFTLGYTHPETTGADRLADMAATVILYGTPALVVDIGTAVTYDLISADKSFFTGAIGPGPEILARSLHDYTALLPLVEWWKKDPPAMPIDTEGAMLFGIEAGFCGIIRETVTRMLPLAQTPPHLIATGGFAERFIKPLGMGFVIDPELTLKGIGLLAVFQERR